MDEDVKDESAAYLEFLNEEVCISHAVNEGAVLTSYKAQKFGTVDDDDDDLEEESLLETPLDKVEPYSLFKNTLMCKSHHCSALPPFPLKPPYPHLNFKPKHS